MKTKTKLSLNRETVISLSNANQIKGGVQTGVGICNHTRRPDGLCPIPKVTDICDA